jgi:GH15 family glucan-1,4-alpha-glucosidase
MGPVRIGNQAYAPGAARRLRLGHPRRHAHLFRPAPDARGDEALFHQLEALGERACEVHDQPDAGLWELRGSAARAHLFQRDVLGRLRPPGAHRRSASGSPRARRTGAHRRAHPRRDLRTRLERKRNSFTSTFDGAAIDASLLLLAEVGFLEADDPRFSGTVAASSTNCATATSSSATSMPTTSARRRTPSCLQLLVCQRAGRAGRRDEARALFERLLACRNRHGLLAEHIDPRAASSGATFVQTYSMVGLINAAIRLSIRWDQAF